MLADVILLLLGPVYLFPKQLGIDRVSSEELEGMNYIMYLVGKHLGITDEFNMCRKAIRCQSFLN
jgi:hypothetical protein